MDIRYIDLNAPKSKMDLQFREEKVCMAYQNERADLVPYVDKATFDKLVGALKSHDEETSKMILDDLGL